MRLAPKTDLLVAGVHTKQLARVERSPITGKRFHPNRAFVTGRSFVIHCDLPASVQGQMGH